MKRVEIMSNLIKLHSLTIFRNLLKDPVICKLAELFKIKGNDTDKWVYGYSEFASALFEHTENLSEYLLNIVLEDENFYMKSCGEGKTPSKEAERALKEELKILENISKITSKDISKEINYDGYLPKWETTEFDFYSIYKKRLKDIKTHGYGIFAKYTTFIVENGSLLPVKNPDDINLTSLSGYKREKKELIDNTKALLKGLPALNVLLYGDAGTGKSTTVKAVANEFKEKGLRLIELKTSQLGEIPKLVDYLSKNPLKFIIFIDDLSFTKDDDDFSALKAMLEGSVSSKSKNLVIYATSNRRHLVKESFSDRDGDDIHANDTMQELSSLSDRFGLTITFIKPGKDTYLSIVKDLALQYNLSLDKKELEATAERFALSRGGRSPRVAKQCVEYLKTLED